MGLKRIEELPNGATATYWTLSRIEKLNYREREAVFTLLGFLDRATSKKEGAVHLTSRDITIRGDEFDKVFRKDGEKQISVEAFYAAAQGSEKDPFFRDAEVA
jgi:hypothetical protein